MKLSIKIPLAVAAIGLAVLAVVEPMATRAEAAPVAVNLFNIETGMCADLPGFGKGKDRGPVNEDTCDYTAKDNQRFYLVPAGRDGAGRQLVHIQNKTDGKCLDLPGTGSVAPATAVMEGRCAGTDPQRDNQQFRQELVAPGAYLLVHQKTGYSLDVRGFRDRRHDVGLTVWPCNKANDDHLWSLIDRESEQVEPSYVHAYDVGLGPVGPWDSRAEFSAPKSSVDGTVAVRFFIPNPRAAGSTLHGDNRKYSGDPRAASRMVYTWDLRSGRASMTIAHSSSFVTGGIGVAFPVQQLSSEQAVLAYAERARNVNYLHATETSFPARDGGGFTSDVTMSTLNAFTGDVGFAAWSVDGTLRVTGDGAGAFSVNWDGNGYPAMEAYLYPRKGGAPRILARRWISPGALQKPWLGLDISGGVAARDGMSWAHCANYEPRRMVCRETGQLREKAAEWSDVW